MKILIATTSGGLEDRVASTFGRAPTFTMVDVDGSDIVSTSISPNEFANAAGGAGIQAAQWVINSGAQGVIAGNFGPNASDVFTRSKIKVVACGDITVREAVQKYIKGELADFSPDSPNEQGYSPGMEMARESGRGGGRGMGQGRGGSMGRGQGGRR